MNSESIHRILVRNLVDDNLILDVYLAKGIINIKVQYKCHLEFINEYFFLIEALKSLSDHKICHEPS